MSRVSALELVRVAGRELAPRLEAAGLRGFAADLRAALVRAAGLRAPAGPPPAHADLSVLRHLPEAMRLARRPATSALADTLGPLLPLVHWGQSPGYVADPPNATFLAGYAHATLLGSGYGRPVTAEPAARVAVGLLLLGPHVHYPPHEHPADEVYVPLAPARWSDQTLNNAVRPPGDVLHHPPGHPHAMRTGDTPLLALYVWRGDIATPARIHARN